MKKSQSLLITQIRRDSGAQFRVPLTKGGVEGKPWLSEQHVVEIEEAIEEKVKLPPIIVFFDGTLYWLGDGDHRIEAFERKGLKKIDAEVREGSQMDARRFGRKANSEHNALKRSAKTKRASVIDALNDPEWEGWSNVAISKGCGVSEKFVRQIKNELGLSSDSRRYAERNGTTYEVETAKIGGAKSLFNSPSTSESTGPGDQQESVVSDGGSSANTAAPSEETADDGDPFSNEAEPSAASNETSSEVEATESDQSNGATSDSVAESAAASQENPESQTAPATAEEKKEPTVEEIVDALPLAKALSLYGHNGHIFRQDAIFCLEHKDVIGKLTRKIQGDLRHKKGHRIDIWKQAIQNNDPAQWEGCPACKGSLRFGERRDPCHSCNATGYTTRKDEGVSADVVASYAQEFNS